MCGMVIRPTELHDMRCVKMLTNTGELGKGRHCKVWGRGDTFGNEHWWARVRSGISVIALHSFTLHLRLLPIAGIPKQTKQSMLRSCAKSRLTLSWQTILTTTTSLFPLPPRNEHVSSNISRPPLWPRLRRGPCALWAEATRRVCCGAGGGLMRRARRCEQDRSAADEEVGRWELLRWVFRERHLFVVF